MSGGVDLTNLHSDIYVVTDVNPGGKKFDKVNRLVCKGQDAQADLIIDIASVEYSLVKGDRFKLCLSGTLRIDGKPDEDVYNQDGKVCTPLSCKTSCAIKGMGVPPCRFSTTASRFAIST